MKINNQLIADLREDYRAKTLNIADIAPHPILQFNSWFQEALDSAIKEPNAMTLATVQEGKPTARIVLLKGVAKKGFIFYTNYESNKGIEIEKNPNVALVFLWKDLERQIRIEGTAKKISKKDSIAYFHSRPKGSQIGAWTSPQSQIIKDRSVLEDKYLELEQTYKDQEKLPKPPHWGGYQVKPTYMEFWQGRSSRLHDRIAYSLKGNGKWTVDRLAP